MYSLFCDGASRGQGVKGKIGEGAIGVAIYKNRKMIGQFARGIGKATNNEAEFEAVLHAILMAWAADLQDPIIYSDSAVVVKLVNGEWECRTPAFEPYLLTIKDLKEVFRFRLIQRPRAELWEPDALANMFLDKLAASRKENKP